MEKELQLNEDLVWLCFVNYVRTYEQVGEMPRATEPAKNDARTTQQP